jgi:hypothetical protein
MDDSHRHYGPGPCPHDGQELPANGYHVHPKPEPETFTVPWWMRAWWTLWANVTWPWEARKLKREGWHRTGWRTWESP